MEFDDADDFGTFIRNARKTKGLSQEDLAATLKVSQPAVSAWESNRTLPTIPLLGQLARLLDVDAARLVALATVADDDQAVAL